MPRYGSYRRRYPTYRRGRYSRPTRKNPMYRSFKANPNKPPPFTSNNIYQKTFRFRNGSAESKGGIDVNQQCILNLLSVGYHASAAVQNRRLISAIRIKCIEMWATPDASDWDQLNFEWAGQRNPGQNYNVSGTNVHPGYLKVYPPQGSQASFWMNTGTSGAQNLDDAHLFSCDSTIGAIMDLHVEFTLWDQDSEDAFSPILTVDSPSGVNIGNIYYNSLDNTYVSTPGTYGSGTYDWGPVGVTTTCNAHT